MNEEELRTIFNEVSTEEPLAGGWPNLFAYGKAVAEAADHRARRECAEICRAHGEAALASMWYDILATIEGKA